MLFNMVDNIRQDELIASSNDEDLWRRKYFTLLKHCRAIEQDNERLVNRIYHVKRLLKRQRKQRSFLKERLDEHNDDYRDAQPPFQAELLSEIVSESLPKAFTQPFLPLEFVSPGSPSVKKSKNRSAPKLDKDKDPNAPKKPANAFFMFCQQQRNVMQDDLKDPNIGHHEITKSLAKEWNNLASTDKKVYYEMYERDKERYEKEMKKYTTDKGPKKDTAPKKPRTKSAKQKSAGLSTSTKASPGVAEISLDQNTHVVSPTLNSLSPQSLACIPQIPLPRLPSPQLLPLSEEGSAFDNYQELPSPSQDSFM